MNPTSDNIKVALLEQLSNEQKLAALSSRDRISQEEYYHARFSCLIEAVKKIATPVEDGVDPARGSRPGSYQTPDLKIAETTQGDLMLQLFLYAPGNLSYGHSLYAAWHLQRGENRHLILSEYLSDRSFIPDTAAYRPDTYHLLSLLEESVTSYKRVQEGPRLSNGIKKLFKFASEHIN